MVIDFLQLFLSILVGLLAGVLGGVFLYIRKKRCFELVAHFESADARRRAHPPVPRAHPSCVRVDSVADEFIHEHGFFRGLWWQIVRPKTGSFDAVVVGVHGYADHSDFAMMYHAHELRRGANVAVVLFDQPGFGRSDGLWCHIKDWFVHVETCRSFIELFVKTRFPGTRIFGLGFSMGGGILTTLEATRPCLDGMVLLAPMLIIRPEVKPHPHLHRVLLWLAKLLPTWPVAINNHNGQISYRDLAYQAQVQELNKLQYQGYPRLGTAVQLLRAQQWLERNCHRVTCPYLVLHGTADVVTSVEGSRNLVACTAKAVDKQLVELEGYYHNVLGPGQDHSYNHQPYELICEWIKARL